MLLFLDNWRSAQGRAQREPRPRAARAAHRRPDLGLHRGDGQGLGQDPVRLHRRRLRVAGTATTTAGKHTTGPVQVLGFTAANGSADGRALTRDYLRYLAHHPATARTIARKLAVRFVSDAPSDALVDAPRRASSAAPAPTSRRRCARWSRTGSSGPRRGSKVRTPIDDLVHTVRVLGVTAQRPSGREGSFADAIALAAPGRPALPAGRARTDRRTCNAAWASASRMLGSFRMHWHLAGGYWPERRRHLPPLRRRGCRSAGSGSTSTSTTCAG